MKPVTVPSHAFVFCRYTIAALVWAAFFARSVWILAAAGAILFLSALLKVRRAPMIQLYSQTALRFYKCPDEVLDETAMRFAHALGTCFAVVCLILLAISPGIGWRATLLFAIMKTISALGFCPASKLFTCATNTSCCPVSKKFLGLCGSGRIDPPK